jgi:hypothetical protein
VRSGGVAGETSEKVPVPDVNLVYRMPLKLPLVCDVKPVPTLAEYVSG